MHQCRSMPRWWRYCYLGAGLFMLIATGALYVAFDPSTLLGYFSLFLLVLTATSLFLAGLETQTRLGTHRIWSKHFLVIGQLSVGASLLVFPAVAFLEQTVEPYDVLVGAGGLFMLVIGLGTLYRPAAFGPYASAD